ncbi:MAG: AsmA protein [Gammaproteobacteria bacterium]|jgi:AsmA protein
MSGLIRKIIKLCLTVIVVAVIFVAAIAGVFIATFDANQYKQDLSDLVRDETGRDLQFYGDVSLTFYPALGMKLGALSLSNAPGFGSEPMIKVNKVSISVDVASIIAFSPEIDQLILDSLEINLQKNKKGITNWDDLIKPDETQASGTTPSATAADSDAKPMKISGAFGGLNITNAQLSWMDAQAGAEYQLQNLMIKTGRITPDAPFAFQMQVALESKGEIKADVDLESQIQYLFDKAQLNLTDLALNIAATGEQLPLGKMQVGLNAKSIVLNLQRRSVSLKGLVLALDDSTLTGEVNVSDYAQPALSFKLASDNLDIDALLGTPAVQPGQASSDELEPVVADAAEQDVQISLPMELLRTIGIDGELAVAQLKIQNLIMRDIDVGISADKGVVNLDPIKMNLYDGSFSGQVQLDARADFPKYRVSKKLQAVQIGKLLTDFSGEDRISGGLNADVSINTQGEWLSELKKNSNGNLKLAFKDGALSGFNIRHSIEKAKAKLKGKPAPSNQARKTDFSSLELSGQIVNGIFSSDDLNLQAPIMRVSGEGQANLNDSTVNYLVRAKLVATTKGQEGGEADQLAGILIPVRIDGPFADPKIDVQLDEMLKGQAAQKMAEAKAKLEAELEQQKAEIARQKAALQSQIDDEKAKLTEAKKLELENMKKVLEAEAKAKADEAKKKLLDKLFN